MQTLVIYDTTGRIIFQAKGNVQEPEGIPFMWLDIPEGKLLKGINTAVEPHEPIYEDMPKSQIDTINEQLTTIQIALAEALGV